MAIRSASWSASSRYWVVSSTVTPWSARPWTVPHSCSLLRGSRPVVGSSRNSSRGRAIMLIARSSRRRIPPEQVLTCHSHSARVRADQRGEDADESGLAGPVRAEQGEDDPGRDVEVDPVKHDLASEGFPYPASANCV